MIKKINFIKYWSKSILLLPLLLPILVIDSCQSKVEVPKPDGEMYIQFNGIKVICRPTSYGFYTTYLQQGDTAVSWQGNIGGGLGDTLLIIRHSGARIIEKKYRIVGFCAKPDEVSINLEWSAQTKGQPSIQFDGGDYTLDKINGRWVSIVKNGTGYDSNNSNIRYSGIDCRIIWP